MTVLAEIAIAIAGFAGVVVALRGRFEDLSPLARLRLWRLIESSLATALFALIPLAFHHLGLAESTVWSVSSALLAAWLVGVFVTSLHRVRAAMLHDDLPWAFNAAMLVALLLTVSVLIANAFGIGLTRDFGPYFAALLAYLSAAGLVFARLLLARN